MLNSLKLTVGRLFRRLARKDSGLPLEARMFLLGLALHILPITGGVDVDLSVEQVDNNGLNPTFTGSLSTGNTYQFPNDGRTILNFIKTGQTDCVVTLVTPKTVGGLSVADATATVGGTTGNMCVGPFATGLFNDSNGNVTFTLSNITGLSVAVLRV
jgi:hypothetical protein